MMGRSFGAVLLVGCALAHDRPPPADVRVDVGPDVRVPAADASPDTPECDEDGDGTPALACGGADCDDRDPTRSPGGAERCNGLDDDCDGAVDEDAGAPYYRDADGDGFGDPATEVRGCSLPPGSVESADDCDDADPTRHPGAPLGIPRPYAPENGALTGSVHAGDLTLRPTLAWEGAGNCEAEFEVEVDDSCDPETYRDCAFPSPEVRERTTAAELTTASALPVSMRPPVGRRYHWRVRACEGDACTEWSAVRYLDVGRTLADYDGDGYADVAANLLYGGPMPYDGAVVVAQGSADGLLGDTWTTLLDPERETFAGFGQGLGAVGDVDADGFGDLVVGAPNKNGQRGVMFLYRGSVGGLSAPIRFSVAAVTEPLGMGEVVVRAGDVDGDGRSDVAVACGRRLLGVSSVAAVFTARDLLAGHEPTTTLSVSGEIAFAGRGAGGDLDADGLSDLVLDAPELDGAFILFWPSLSLTPWTEGAYEFAGLRIVDLDGDLRPEILAVSYPDRLSTWDPTTRTAGVGRRLGGGLFPSGLAASRDAAGVRLLSAQQYNRACAASVGPTTNWLAASVSELCADVDWLDVWSRAAILDVNGDGLGDALLALANPRDAGVGRLAIWFGSSVPPTGPPDQFFVTPSELGGNFGVSMAD